MSADAPTGTEDHLDGVRAALLEAALPHVPFDGWSPRTVALARQEAGIDPALVRLALPRGPIDLVECFWAGIDRRMTDELSRANLDGVSARGRIAMAVRARLALLAPHKEAARRAAAFQALPIHVASAAASLWRSVDAMWRAVGDTSTDFAFYTKRASLAALWSAVLFTWFGDTGPGGVATEAMLDRRLNDIMRFERGKAGLKALARRVPSPLGVLARLRYPAAGPARGGSAAAGFGAPPADPPADPAADPWRLPRG
jgi:ubiquinone biosynthesis protein COQ9